MKIYLYKFAHEGHAVPDITVLCAIDFYIKSYGDGAYEISKSGLLGTLSYEFDVVDLEVQKLTMFYTKG